MSSADALRQNLQIALTDGASAVGQGAAAMTEGNEGAHLFLQAIQKLEGSRAYALQELQNLTDMIRQLKSLLMQSQSFDAMTALANVEAARMHVEEYANNIGYKIQQLKQDYYIVVGSRIDRELDASGVELRSGIQQLITWAQSL